MAHSCDRQNNKRQGNIKSLQHTRRLGWEDFKYLVWLFVWCPHFARTSTYYLFKDVRKCRPLHLLWQQFGIFIISKSTLQTALASRCLRKQRCWACTATPSPTTSPPGIGKWRGKSENITIFMNRYKSKFNFLKNWNLCLKIRIIFNFKQMFDLVRSGHGSFQKAGSGSTTSQLLDVEHIGLAFFREILSYSFDVRRSIS